MTELGCLYRATALGASRISYHCLWMPMASRYALVGNGFRLQAIAMELADAPTRRLPIIVEGISEYGLP